MTNPITTIQMMCIYFSCCDGGSAWGNYFSNAQHRDPSGFFITAAIGIVGSQIASYGGQALGLYAPGEPAGFIASVVGAIVLLAVYHLVTRNSITS